jgi:hypothetical protein
MCELRSCRPTLTITTGLPSAAARLSAAAEHPDRLDEPYFPSAEAYRKKLEQAHFTVEEIAVIRRPPTLPTGIEAWLDTFAEDFLGPLPQPDRLRAPAEIADLLRPVLMDETGTWIADYVRLRFRTIRSV